MTGRRDVVPSDRVWILAARSTVTNDLLLGALHERGVPAELIGPERVARIGRRDLVLGRLDVRRTLDGVETGLSALADLELRGTRILNPAAALLACHDKLETAIRLGRRGVAQPTTGHIDVGMSRAVPAYPVVIKPRFGSWGCDVFLCESEIQLKRVLRRLRSRPWFKRQGALIQALVAPAGYDLRAVVAGGRVVGAIRRRAAAPGFRSSCPTTRARSPWRRQPPSAATSSA